ncbi:poly(A) polymerase gamma [Cuculus canorus]|uniref:poly(A) polymerase gamma n=1 Tax=Cuculus canorus TaxID=55661 RepID=UPI0023AA76E6|nr:poly(A) polymerase gamma [Cuculus canorus]
MIDLRICLFRNGHVSMWFLGIIFKKAENAERINIDLTCVIQTFIDMVYWQANNLNMLKEGMKIDTAHVKRKHLHQFLPAEILQKRKKQSVSGTSQNASGLRCKRTSSDVSCLDSSGDKDCKTQSDSALLSKIPKLDTATAETERSAVDQISDGGKKREKMHSYMRPPVSKELSIPVTNSKVEATVAVRTSGSPAGSTVPGRNTVSQFRAHFVQGQCELSGSPITGAKNAAPKLPYLPTSEDCSKQPRNGEKLTGQDSAFKDSGNPEDVRRRSTENGILGGRSVVLPLIDTSRSQRLSSKELPDSSSPVPTNSICIIKRSIKLTLNP